MEPSDRVETLGASDDDQKALSAVAAAIGKLPKDKTNKFSGYSYTSEEAVKTAVNRELAKCGFVPDAVTVEILSDVMVSSKKGGEQNLVKVRVTIALRGCTWQGMGAGIDYADKALMKAQTSAVREAWKNGFTIPSGDDPEVPTEDERNSRSSSSAKTKPSSGHEAPPPSDSDDPYRSDGKSEPDDPEGFVLTFTKNKGKALGALSNAQLDWYATDCKNNEVNKMAQAVLDNRTAND